MPLIFRTLNGWAKAPTGCRGGIILRRFRNFTNGSFKKHGVDNRKRKLLMKKLDDAFNNSQAIEQQNPTVSSLKDKFNFPRRKIPKDVLEFVSSFQTLNPDVTWPKFSSVVANQHLQFLTATDYSCLLLQIRPKRDLKLVERTNYNIDTVYAQQYELPDVTTTRVVYTKTWRTVDRVLAIMKEQGHDLTSLEYSHLLNIAVRTRNIDRGEAIWLDMRKHGILPSTYEYNSYIMLHAQTQAIRRQKRRPPIEHERAKRVQVGKPKLDLVGWSFTLYQEMIEKGVQPNAATIEALIVLLGADRQVKGIEHFIERVWGIKPPEDELYWLYDGQVPPESLTVTMDSPLRPSSHTLKAINTALCQNGQLKLAYYYMRKLSATYMVDINKEVMNDVMKWAYILSSERFKDQLGDKVSPLEPYRVWRYMSKTPDRYPPDTRSLDFIIRRRIRQKWLAMATEEFFVALRHFKFVIWPKYRSFDNELKDSFGHDNTRKLSRHDYAFKAAREDFAVWGSFIGTWADTIVLAWTQLIESVRAGQDPIQWYKRENVSSQVASIFISRGESYIQSIQRRLKAFPFLITTSTREYFDVNHKYSREKYATRRKHAVLLGGMNTDERSLKVPPATYYNQAPHRFPQAISRYGQYSQSYLRHLQKSKELCACCGLYGHHFKVCPFLSNATDLPEVEEIKVRWSTISNSIPAR